MYLISLHALTDNYLWLLHDGKHALVAKPGNAGLVMESRHAPDAKLELILVTRRQACDASDDNTEFAATCL